MGCEKKVDSGDEVWTKASRYNNGGPFPALGWCGWTGVTGRDWVDWSGLVGPGGTGYVDAWAMTIVGPKVAVH